MHCEDFDLVIGGFADLSVEFCDQVSSKKWDKFQEYKFLKRLVESCPYPKYSFPASRWGLLLKLLFLASSDPLGPHLSKESSKVQVAKLFLPSSSSHRERSQQQDWQKVFGNRKRFHPENQIWESLMLLISLIFSQYWIFKTEKLKKKNWTTSHCFCGV